MGRQGDEDKDGDEGEADLELFRRAMRDVRPLKGSQRIAGARRRPPARARFARAERAAVLRESLESAGPVSAGSVGVDLYEVQPGDELLFHRTGVPETLLRRLRRGLYRVDYEVDLHGDKDLIAAGDKLNGKRVTITGYLETRSGVEATTKERHVLVVTTLVAAK